jgi:hypothetical protein
MDSVVVWVVRAECVQGWKEGVVGGDNHDGVERVVVTGGGGMEGCGRILLYLNRVVSIYDLIIII